MRSAFWSPECRCLDSQVTQEGGEPASDGRPGEERHEHEAGVSESVANMVRDSGGSIWMYDMKLGAFYQVPLGAIGGITIP